LVIGPSGSRGHEEPSQPEPQPNKINRSALKIKTYLAADQDFCWPATRTPLTTHMEQPVRRPGEPDGRLHCSIFNSDHGTQHGSTDFTAVSARKHRLSHQLDRPYGNGQICLQPDGPPGAATNSA
jgi:hypothetical protein